MRQNLLNEWLQSARVAGTRLSTILLLFCAVTLLTSGAWLFAGCTQAETISGNKDQQPPTGSNAGEVKPQTQSNANTQQPKNGNESVEPKEERSAKGTPLPFYEALEQQGIKLDGCPKDDPVVRRILQEYGAMFIAVNKVKLPPVCMFTSESEVVKFQNDAKFVSALIGGTSIQLQPAAMEALLAARQEAIEQGLNITPRGGSEAARRGYHATLRLWNSRFLPALGYWSGRGRLSREQVARLRGSSIHDQVAQVLELEKSGIFFSKDLSKSILYSVAAPGASQHISMLALDVAQFGNARVRRILARHGWFQTIKSDMPHFTYLGLEEAELPSRGLRSVMVGSQLFWIPDIRDKN